MCVVGKFLVKLGLPGEFDWGIYSWGVREEGGR